jgi:hypothetical protein
MKATPIIPGQCYQVTGAGINIEVHCAGPVQAILQGLCCALAARSLA